MQISERRDFKFARGMIIWCPSHSSGIGLLHCCNAKSSEELNARFSPSNKHLRVDFQYFFFTSTYNLALMYFFSEKVSMYKSICCEIRRKVLLK